MKIKRLSGAILCVITGILFGASIMWGNKLFSDNLPSRWIEGVILFLFAYELMIIIITHKKIEIATPRQVISLYLLLKGGKIIAFLAFLMIYILAIQVETKRFILVAVTVYLIYLLFDTFYLASSEKKLKNEDL
ncbi:MAG: hypothetical protein LBG15_11500 [Dysgonamonadaceae bacterium]|jgi:hypothetical protein|nr:hypothetical protein [Dysgonamonadaceae bacterium]